MAGEGGGTEGGPKVSGSIHVSTRQKGNPLLKSLRKVPWEFVEGLQPDYVLGTSCVALYLSVRYHTLQPDYIHERLKELFRYHKIKSCDNQTRGVNYEISIDWLSLEIQDCSDS